MKKLRAAVISVASLCFALQSSSKGAEKLPWERSIQEVAERGLAVQLTSIYQSRKGLAAIALSNRIPLEKEGPARRIQGQLVITLTLNRNGWHVADRYFDSEKSAQDELQRFIKKYPDAKQVPPPEK